MQAKKSLISFHKACLYNKLTIYFRPENNFLEKKVLESCSNNNKEISLAIETSGRIGSVAIGCGDQLLSESAFSGFMKHSTELFPRIETLLGKINKKPSDVRDLYITAGPGSFTGLRIAVTVAKMLNMAHKTRIIAADSMDVLAENATTYNQTGGNADCVATVLDAKRNLFFAAVFEKHGTGWKKILNTELVSADELTNKIIDLKKDNVAFLGEGLVYYADKFKAPFSSILDQQYWPATASGLFRVGRKLASSGNFTNPATLTPFYVRRPEAVENWEKRQKSK